MSDESNKPVREIFANALELKDPLERERYLAQACGPDAKLRQMVEALLSAYQEAGRFLQPTQVVPPEQLIGEGPGTVIGRYKLLQEIGQGGFGVVFMAEQLEPVQRKVALKIIKAGMDTREVIARFEAERQALALMDHPSIARVLDAGATESGRPYFVMELVKGIRITDYCDQNDLPTEDRLKLFMKVCHAVQHAHQKGIIHRDLKPSNVMVTLHDGEAVPKVIDFGIAKATGQRLTDKTLFTRYEQMIGTPAYMSPEQAAMSGLDVDTRTDIYALGVLLYELLTGVTPFDKETLAKAAFDEIRRMIRETEPPKPSTRLHVMGDKLTEVAKHRHTEPGGLRRSLRGDLDWIVMKALEKDRRRRYETANDLAGDLERHLEHQPVVAGPPSAVYRARKFIRRHRLGVAVSASMTAVLITGLVVSLLAFAKARKERDRAMAAEERAEASRQTAQVEGARSAQVAQFMKDMLQGVGPGVALGGDTKLLRGILDQTAGRLSKELAGQAAVEADLRETLGVVYRDLGEYVSAEAMLQKSLAMRKKLHGEEHCAVASAQHNLAEVFRLQSKNDEARAGFQQALALRRKLLGNEHREVADSLFGLAEVLRRQSDALAEAEAAHREALSLRRKLLGKEHPDVARSLNGLGVVLRNQGKLEEAEKDLREAVGLERKLLGDKHPDTANALGNLGITLLKQPGRLPEAEKVLREAFAIQKEVLGEHRDTAITLKALSAVAKQLGRSEEAEQLSREALAMEKKLLGAQYSQPTDSLPKLIAALQREGKLAEAEARQRELLASQRKLLGNDHAQTIASLASLANLLLAECKLPEAETVLRELLPLQKKTLGNEHSAVAQTLHDLGQTLANEGKPAEAEPFYREALALRLKLMKDVEPSLTGLLSVLRKQRRSDEVKAVSKATLEAAQAVLREKQTPEVFKFTSSVISAFMRAGVLAAAETLAREALVARKKVLGDVHRDVARSLYDLGSALEARGNLVEAETVLLESAAIYTKLGLIEHPDAGLTLGQLRRVLTALGKHDPEIERLARVDEVRQATRYKPLVSYKLRIQTPGQYRLFLRWDGHDPESDSLYAQIAELKDGPGGAVADFYYFAPTVPDADFATFPWQGDASPDDVSAPSVPTVWNITKPGDYTLMFNRREDGSAVDAFVLQLSSLPPPQGDGPPESEFTADKTFLEREGRIVGEAEHFATRVSTSGGLLRWLVVPQESPGDVVHLHYRGTGYIQSLPDATPEQPAKLLANRALARTQEGDYAGAEALLRKELETRRKRLGNEHPDIAKLLGNLAIVLRAQGKLSELEAVCRDLDERGDALALNNLAWQMATSADGSMRDGRRAVVLAERAVAVTGRTNASYLDTLAAALAETGDFSQAVHVQQEAVALLKDEGEKKGYASRLRLYESGLPCHDDASLAQRISTLLADGKFAEAEPLARECLAIRERQIPDEWLTFNTRSLLGTSLLGQKKYTEAEPLLLAGYEGMKQREEKVLAGGGRSRLKETLQRLVQLYEATARPDQAAEWKQKLAELESLQGATGRAATAQLHEALILHFTFDELEADGRVTDASDRGNHGRVSGAQWDSGGRHGGAFRFTPPNQYIIVSNSASLNPPQLTIAAWIKTSRRDQVWRRVLDKGYRDGFALSIGGMVGSNARFMGKAALEIGMQINNQQGFTPSDGHVTDGKWHHLAAVYDGAVQSLYVDGVRQSRVARWSGRVPANAHDLTIGLNLLNPAAGEVGASFDGLIDEVMLFNRALSPKEIASLFSPQ
jgi:eukaryotic-like serine/threonine-protein kinase